jgi:hypothetical protein
VTDEPERDEEEPEEERVHRRDDFFRDLRKVTRKLEPEEREPQRPSEPSGGRP